MLFNFNVTCSLKSIEIILIVLIILAIAVKISSTSFVRQFLINTRGLIFGIQFYLHLSCLSIFPYENKHNDKNANTTIHL